MTEELLDRPQIGAALEEVRGERVPQPVRVADEAADGARVEPAPTGGEEERIDGAARERRASVSQVAREPKRGLLAERDDTVLPALAAADVHRLALEVHIREVEADSLGAPQTAGVEELEESCVPQGEGRISMHLSDDALDLCDLRRIGQSPRTADAETCLGHSLAAEREPDPGADRRQPSGDRRGSEPIAPATEIVTIPATRAVRSPVSFSGIAVSRTDRRRNGETAPRLAEKRMSAQTAVSFER